MPVLVVPVFVPIRLENKFRAFSAVFLKNFAGTTVILYESTLLEPSLYMYVTFLLLLCVCWEGENATS